MITRLKGAFAEGLIDVTDADEDILKKLTYALEVEFCRTSTEIARVLDFLSTDDCPLDYLGHLAALVLAPYFSAWTESRRRFVIRSTVFLWLIKGTHRSWGSLLRLFSYTNITPWELFKSEVYETEDYVALEDVGHPYRAARVMLVEDLDPGSPVSDDQIALLMAILETVRPIHVLHIPADIAFADLSDALSLPCDSACEAGCETSGEQEIVGVFQDDAPSLTDSLSVTITCLAACESVCQSGCQGHQCETSCEALCEGACQSGCTTACETSCQFTCQLGGCEEYCESVGCQTACVLGCEVGVETGLE